MRKIRTKQTKKKKADRSSEECDARRSERLQEEHAYVLKRNITTARTKQHEDEEGDTGIRPKKDKKQKNKKKRQEL